MKIKRMKKRILSLVLCMVMLSSFIPPGIVTASVSTEEGGLCDHHPEHTKACGYSEGSAGSTCKHKHTEDCYNLDEYASPSDADETDPVNCTHEHDETCGYVEANEGSPCTYNCDICFDQDLENEDETVDETANETAGETADEIADIMLDETSELSEEEQAAVDELEELIDEFLSNYSLASGSDAYNMDELADLCDEIFAAYEELSPEAQKLVNNYSAFLNVINGTAVYADDEAVAMIGSKTYDSFSDAIDAVQNGDTITLLQDVTGNVKTENKNYTIDMNGHIIEGTTRGIWIAGGTVEIKNGTISGADNPDDDGGGVYVTNAATVTLTNVTVEKNTAAKYGAGICVYKSSLTIENSKICGNTLTGTSTSTAKGGGIYADSGSTLIVRGTTIGDNMALMGGGIYMAGALLTIEGSTISNNQATGKSTACGGGVLVDSSNKNAEVEISDTEVIGNQTSGSCGGFHLSLPGNSSNIQLENVKLLKNEASSNGVALYMTANGSFSAEDCKFNENKGNSGKSILYFTGSGEKSLNDCEIKNNSSIEKTVYVMNGTLTVKGGEISSNEAEKAGAVYLNQINKKNEFSGTVIKNNTATGSDDTSTGGIYVAASSEVVFESGAIYKNKTAGNNKGNDWSIEKNSKVTLLSANSMSDMSDSASYFGDYIWWDQMTGVKYKKVEFDSVTEALYLTARGDRERDIASVGEERYKDLQEAVDSSSPVSEVLLVAGDYDDLGTAFSSEAVTITTDCTIDVNGRTVSAEEENIFKIKDEAKLTLSGSGTIHGTIQIQENSSLSIDGAVALDSIVHNGDTLTIGANVGTLAVTLGKDKVILAENNFDWEQLTLTLDSALMAELNNATSEKNDIVLIKNVGTGKEDLAKKITINELTNPLVSVVVKDGNFVLSKSVLSGVFIDGVNGDDSNEGKSYENPVKTMERAKNILMDETSLDTIYVLGTVSVDGEEKWDLNNKTFARYPSYTDNLINVKGNSSLTLSNIVIDGASEYGTTSNKSLINVENGAELTMDDGAILQNNALLSTGISMGGGICSSGTVNINGGTIKNCSAVYGGGVYTGWESILYINGGEIINNQAGADGCGGGVMIAYDGKAIMTGGLISNNESKGGVGGGVSVGSTNAAFLTGNPSFEMNGGTISENVADSSGGGIYVECECKATISAGNVTDNAAKAGRSSLYAGGGIYVNGGRSGYEDGQLFLYNVIIANNDSQNHGGGMGACPSSKVRIYVNEGGAVYGNTSEESGNDIYVTAQDSAAGGGPNVKADVYISEVMLGGALNHWTYNNGIEVPVNYLTEMGTIAIKNGNKAESTAVANAKRLAKVYITGNTSRSNGGGVGTNGNVTIGTAPEEETIDISVKKMWNDKGKESLRPEYVDVWLLRNGEPLYFVRAAKDLYGNWPEVSFIKQPKKDDDGNDYIYTVKEDAAGIQGIYESEVTGSDNSFTVTNTPVETGSLVVSKTVSGSGADSTKDFTFTVTLSEREINGAYGDMTFNDGVAVFTLKAGDIKTAKNLPAGVSYTVEESDNAEYTVTVNGKTGEAATGTITAGETASAAFNNYKSSGGNIPSTDPEYGGLIVSKTVSGSGASKTKKFTFTVTLDDETVSGEYGEMTFENGVAVFTLKAGESRTASDLSPGVGYSVEESDNAGYTVTVNGNAGEAATGKITAGETVSAAFNNYKKGGGGGDDGGGSGPSSGSGSSSAYGGIKITKEVQGDRTLAAEAGYEFRVWVENSSGEAVAETVSYTIAKEDGTAENGSVAIDADGYTFYLKDGESITFSGIESGRQVRVQELAAGDFTTTAGGLTDDVYLVEGNKTGKVVFINTYEEESESDDSDSLANLPTDGMPKERALPKTGDTSNTGFWYALACLALLGIAVVLFGKKRE